VYLATNIATVLSEIVAVRVCGKNGGIGIPGASASAAESLTWKRSLLSRCPTSRDFVPWRFLDAGQLSVRSLLVAGIQKPAHFRTHTPQQTTPYSITSSAFTSTASGIVRPSTGARKSCESKIPRRFHHIERSDRSENCVEATSASPYLTSKKADAPFVRRKQLKETRMTSIKFAFALAIFSQNPSPGVVQ
jgi:hypothetical protein